MADNIMNVDPPRPEPEQIPYAKPHYDALQEERLVVQECQDCGERQHFPRPYCMFCTSEDLDWIECSGSAELYSYSIPRRVVEVPEYGDEIPYVMAFVDIEEGPRFHTNVVNCELDDLEVGMDLEAVFDHIDEDLTLVRFQPADEDLRID